jgi:hypothetical protein
MYSPSTFFAKGAVGDPQRKAVWTALQDSPFNQKHVLLAQVISLGVVVLL